MGYSCYFRFSVLKKYKIPSYDKLSSGRLAAFYFNSSGTDSNEPIIGKFCVTVMLKRYKVVNPIQECEK
jgi:hypothetical protein